MREENEIEKNYNENESELRWCGRAFQSLKVGRSVRNFEPQGV